MTLRGVEIPIDANQPEIGKHLEPAGRWNRFEGELQNNRLSLKLNGKTVWKDKEVSASKTGPLKLQAPGPVQFANIYIRKLKSAP